MPSLLETKALTKRFGGLTAISDLHFRLDEGELRCLVGPNGAGKTTFFTGREKPTAGEIYFGSEPISHLSVHEIARQGIGRKFQIPSRRRARGGRGAEPSPQSRMPGGEHERDGARAWADGGRPPTAAATGNDREPRNPVRSRASDDRSAEDPSPARRRRRARRALGGRPDLQPQPLE